MIVKKALYIVFAVMFAYMVAVQFNDPDPAYWIVVYGLISISSIARFFGYSFDRLLPFVFGLTVAGLLIAAPGFLAYLYAGDYPALFDTMSSRKPYVEPAREFLGLLIAAIVVAQYTWSKKL